MYKDPDKQREAQRNWVRQKRATKGSTEQGSTINLPEQPPEGAAVYDNAVQSVPALDGNAMINTKPKFIPEHLANLTNEIAAASPKRGKDIKTFADLPPDVQATINRLSDSNEEKAKRTKAAIKYQHLFPDRYYSTGAGQARTSVLMDEQGNINTKVGPIPEDA